jgi:outer membrane protein
MGYMSFMNKQLVKAVLGVALVFAVAMPASAQETKIGVVSLQAIVEREREILAKQKEIEDLQAKVQKDLAVMGETERRNAEKNLRELGRDFERLRTEFQEDSNLRQNEEIGQLQRAILKEVQDYAEAQGYGLIVGDGVLYVSSSVNITEDVLNAVIANHQAQSQ